MTLDASGAVTNYATIQNGNGIFAQVPVRVGDIVDGTSNTAAFSESTLGTGGDRERAAERFAFRDPGSRGRQ